MLDPRDRARHRLAEIQKQINSAKIEDIDENNPTPDDAAKLLVVYSEIMDSVFGVIEDEIRSARAAHQEFTERIDTDHPNKPMPTGRLKKTMLHLHTATEIAGSLNGLLHRSAAMTSLQWKAMQARQSERN